MSPYLNEIQCSTIDILLGSDVYFTFSEFAGIRNTGKTVGLGDNLRVELNRSKNRINLLILIRFVAIQRVKKFLLCFKFQNLFHRLDLTQRFI